MILGFKPQFVEKILTKDKHHTIRVDAGKRWKKGRKIHFATGVRTKNYKQFAVGTCDFVLRVSIKWQGTTVKIKKRFPDTSELTVCDFNTAAQHTEHSGNGYNNLLNLALADGFNSVDEFLNWFDKDYEGVIIYWSDFKVCQ